MNNHQPNQGILNEHATCQKASSRSDMRERAVELAAMNGRSPLDTSKSDWEQAKREMTVAAPAPHPLTEGEAVAVWQNEGDPN